MSFVESEDHIEYGLLVTLTKVLEFQREDDNADSFLRWNESDDPEGDYDDRSNDVKWTREMLSNGEI